MYPVAREEQVRHAIARAHAQRIVAAFAIAGTGTVGIDGKMVDMPHLKQAQTLLARAGVGAT